MFFFLANLKATELQTVRGVKLFMEGYLADVDFKLTDKLLHFYLYVRQSQKLTLEHSLSVPHGNLYQIMCKEKIYIAFPNGEAIFTLRVGNGPNCKARTRHLFCSPT